MASSVCPLSGHLPLDLGLIETLQDDLLISRSLTLLYLQRLPPTSPPHPTNKVTFQGLGLDYLSLRAIVQATTLSHSRLQKKAAVLMSTHFTDAETEAEC